MSFKRLLPFLLSVILFVSIAGTAVAAMPSYGEEWENTPDSSPTVNFTDLPSTHWAYKYIADMVSRKVMDGYPDNKFRPNNTITRAEFAKIMVTASGIGAKKVNYSSFSDVPIANWASPFVESVKDYMTGYRTANGQYIFNPTQPALREDITVALVKLKGYEVTRLPDHSTLEAMFTDYKGISESAKDYIAIAVENGLVSGYADETFRPQATVTRAEAAVLLWRAYQYGNDNKEVGSNNDGTATTPTSPETQPGQPSTPTTPEEADLTEPAAKFTVDTLVGGTGPGDIDGPVRMAKINRVDSMIVDKNNNVYFLDAAARKIRRFNSSNGTVETFKTIDTQFNWTHATADQELRSYDHQYFVPSKLGYSLSDNKMYLLGLSSKRGEFNNDFVFDITNNATMATYVLRTDDDLKVGYSSTSITMRFLTSSGAGKITYGYDWSWRGDAIYTGEQGVEAELIGQDYDQTGVSLYGRSDAIVNGNEVHIFDTGISALSKITLFPRKVETVVSLSGNTYDSVTNYNGKFYIASASTIYQLTSDGKLSTFIHGNDLVYNDGSPIRKINHLHFDNQGNVIVYDDNNKAIRRINL
ncbi:S-layer homology domain-containing protein [Paenibacillus sp. PAMC21692]|uniref:S-layer homology domain-containing protein n=1 Tax=Paenibacillus sp. PAMC21692 TaxID=2762320 RepID=UPI00164D32F0|nr:S-layer homology domain-containing protein [Paenibacillus sp. PAMC21692]QNK57447.1 S-layer homology domain-containing protein [Paenibacillus sp. PAMC21692]